MQVPPTPTPLPQVQSPITLPDVSLWDSAPTAISMWNAQPTFTTFFQALLILFIVFMIVMFIINAANRVSTHD